MGKIVTLPSWLNASEFKQSVFYPIDSNDAIVDSVNNAIEFNNLRFSELKVLLNNADYDLSSMLSNANINPWARFKSNKIAPHSIGEFAGYNKNANPPSRVLIGDTTIQKTYINGTYNYEVSCNVVRGELEPIYDGLEASWGTVVVSFEVDGVVKYADVNVDSNIDLPSNKATVTFVSNNNNGEVKTCTIKAYYTNAVGSTDSYTNPETGVTINAVQLVGYGDGHTYGLLIEGGAVSASLNLTPAPKVEFEWSLSYSTTQHLIGVTLSPTIGVSYSWGAWESTSGDTVISQTNSGLSGEAKVDLGPDQDGIFQVSVTATDTSGSGKAPSTKVITVTIIDNQLIQPL